MSECVCVCVKVCVYVCMCVIDRHTQERGVCERENKKRVCVRESV